MYSTARIQREFRKGPSFHGSRSYGVTTSQNASCQLGGRKVPGRKTSFLFSRKTNGREVTAFLGTHDYGFLHPSMFPEANKEAEEF